MWKCLENWTSTVLWFVICPPFTVFWHAQKKLAGTKEIFPIELKQISRGITCPVNNKDPRRMRFPLSQPGRHPKECTVYIDVCDICLTRLFHSSIEMWNLVRATLRGPHRSGSVNYFENGTLNIFHSVSCPLKAATSLSSSQPIAYRFFFIVPLSYTWIPNSLLQQQQQFCLRAVYSGTRTPPLPRWPWEYSLYETKLERD